MWTKQQQVFGRMWAVATTRAVPQDDMRTHGLFSENSPKIWILPGLETRSELPSSLNLLKIDTPRNSEAFGGRRGFHADVNKKNDGASLKSTGYKQRLICRLHGTEQRFIGFVTSLVSQTEGQTHHGGFRSRNVARFLK